MDINKLLQYYPPSRNKIIKNLLELILSSEFIPYVYIGGALTFNRIDKYSDLDIHCIIKNDRVKEINDIISSFISLHNNEILYVIEGRNYPWFGDLITIFFDLEEIFSIDLGYIKESQMDDFYFQFNGQILKDLDSKLKFSVEKCFSNELIRIEKIYDSQIKILISSVVKLRKSIKRGLLINAYENLNLIRRSYIFFLSYNNYYEKKFPFIGQPERDIEICFDKSDILFLNNTIPSIEASSILSNCKSIINKLLLLESIKRNPKDSEFINRILNDEREEYQS